MKSIKISPSPKKNKKTKTRGAALIEYAMLVGLIGAGSIAAVGSTGTNVSDIFCEAANGMVQITGETKNARCVTTPNDLVVLAENEEFVEAPLTIQADFSDILFDKNEVGSQLVMKVLDPAALERFLLTTSLTSKDPHEQSRTVASCYTVGGGVDPICSTPGASSQVTVPAGATSFGYLVSLSDNQLPWTNDVSISITDYNLANTLDWDIEVGREEADAVTEDVLVAFGDHTYAQNDTGWTYGPFATLNGTFNRPLQFSMINLDGPTRLRQACYVPFIDADPICSDATSQGSTAQITVAPGAVSLGYQILLPAETIGTTWTTNERLLISQSGSEISREDITIDRPGASYEVGGVSGTFTDFTYNETDTDWTEGQFVALTGTRNTTLIMRIASSGAESTHTRRACYKVTASSTPVCGNNATSSNSSSISVPTSATLVGYEVDLPGETSGPDHVYQQRVILIGQETIIEDKIVTVTRPNPDYVIGALVGTFADFTYEETDTSWTEGQFVALTETTRNTTLIMRIASSGAQSTHTRRACYKVTASSTPVCGNNATSSSSSSISVPTSATLVGYEVDLPGETSGPDHVYQQRVILIGQETIIEDKIVTVTRPNPDYVIGALVGTFADFTYEETDTSWTEGQFVALTETTRNTTLIMRIASSGAQSTHTRRACYKVTASSTPVCGNNATSSSSSSISVPTSATLVGYEVDLPGETSGPDHVYQQRVILIGQGTVIEDKIVTVTRPNPDYVIGALAGTFADFTYEETDTGWTEGQFVALTGTRNTTLIMKVISTGAQSTHTRRACYKVSPTSTPVCGNNASTSGTSSISVPTSATLVGYEVNLPGVTSGPDHVYQHRVNLTGQGTVMEDKVVTVTRPNGA
jgi:Flp pilus assembly pilin Flp